MARTSQPRKARLLALAVLSPLILIPGPGLAGDPHKDKPYPNIVKPAAQFGMFGNGPGQFNDPTRVAITSGGEIYVAECFNNRVQVFDRSGRYLRMWSGKIRCPRAIAVDEAAGIVVVGDESDRITVFDTRGRTVRSFGKRGNGIGALRGITDIALRDGRIYVSEDGNNRVQVFSGSGRSLRVIGTRGADAARTHRPLGVAVDDAGNVFAVDALHRVQKFGPDGRFVQQWGRYGGLEGMLSEPSDLSYASGFLYVADLTNHRLQVFDTAGRFRVQWGRHPENPHEGQGHLHYPMSLDVSPDGVTAVTCEPFEYRCQVFAMDKVRSLPHVDVNAWWEKFPKFHYGGGARIARHEEVRPLRDGPAKLHDVLLITEPDLRRVVTFHVPEDGATLSKLWGVTGGGHADDFGDAFRNLVQPKLADNPRPTISLPTGDDDLPHPCDPELGVAQACFLVLSAKMPLANGDALIGDAGRNYVHRYDLLTGRHLATHFGPGKKLGQFNGPSGIAEGADGRVYVGDFHNDRMQVFDRDMKPLFAFGRTGDKDGEFSGPIASAFDRQKKRLYVVDSSNARIQVFDTAGKHLFSFGRRVAPGEWGRGTFLWPFDIAIGAHNRVYVTDPSLQTVQVFSPNGKFLFEWGSWGTRPGEFYKPKGIDVDSKGNVYVIDFGNHRGQIFDKNGRFIAIFGEGELYPAKTLDANGDPIPQPAAAAPGSRRGDSSGSPMAAALAGAAAVVGAGGIALLLRRLIHNHHHPRPPRPHGALPV